jgi:hypothetical protein
LSSAIAPIGNDKYKATKNAVSLCMIISVTTPKIYLILVIWRDDMSISIAGDNAVKQL